MVLALTFVFGTIRRSISNPDLQATVIGSVFGAAAIVAMAEPINLGGGVIVDLRTLMVALAIGFSGPLAGAIAALMAVTFRLYLGGTGAVPGSAALLVGYGLGLGWHYLLRPRIGNDLLSDIALGATISLALVTGLMLPPEIRWTFIRDLGPIVTVSNILGAILIGSLFRREMRAQRNEQLLEDIASKDHLTGALNRHGTARRLAGLPGEGARAQALIYFDIDNFKLVNDRYGHAAGDLALKVVTQRVRACLRDDAIFSREGGDEFTVMLGDVTGPAVEAIAERFCAIVRADPIEFEGRPIPITISVGAFWSSEPLPFESLRAAADRNLFLSKEAGRDRATVTGANQEAGGAGLLDNVA